MFDKYNPFKENRTEQMKDLWKYYVPFPGFDGAGKPLVVEGGRGSGKTMFFQCNSWKQCLSEIRKNEEPYTHLLDQKPFIGIYYRVDTAFVSSMKGREENNWSAVFETYLSICILKEMLELISALNSSMKIDESELIEFSKQFSQKLNANSSIDNIYSFLKESDLYLDIIEDKINGVDYSGTISLRYVKAQRFITDLCGAIQSLFKRDNLLFKIFIDEYETLQEYQQKIINTLIKHSTLPLIFNIGLKPKGMKTAQTNSETETIEAPHDYELLSLVLDQNKYSQIIKDICAKRINLGKEQGKIPPTASDNIEDYLGEYSIDYEISKILKSKNPPTHIENLRNKILELCEEESNNKETAIEYCKVLCDDAPIINSRVHYALLCKKTPYTPKINELYEEYVSKSARYKEWMHNRKFGALFLLCKEKRIEKLYYGFDVYSALSSNIVRYFLELCERAFDIAFLNDYNWEGSITPEHQTQAAQYVSEYKIADIAGYEPYGKELRVFVQYLGNIFYRLHSDDDITLGEPEPNHFNTKDLSLSKHAKELIASAIMCNVLQEGEPTKKKQATLSPETVDYYLNKIYVPYFKISYRNQRKIQLEIDILEQLLSGDEEIAKKAFSKYFKLPEKDGETKPKKNSKRAKKKSSDNSSQLSLFDNATEDDND